MKPETYRFFSESLGRTVIVSDDLPLTRDAIWISDRAVDEDGAHVFGNKAGVPHKNKRVRRFTCFAGIRHQGDPDTWFFRTGLATHDQGGTLKLVTDEAEPRTFWLRMRRPVWPYGRNDAATTLYVHDAADDGGIGQLISYAWSTYDARRVGLNLMWMQARCQLPEG